jgi:hypothetical protein
VSKDYIDVDSGLIIPKSTGLLIDEIFIPLNAIKYRLESIENLKNKKYRTRIYLYTKYIDKLIYTLIQKY